MRQYLGTRFFTGTWLLILFWVPGITEGDHIKDHITDYTVEAAKEWASSRGCAVTPNGTKILAKRLHTITDVLETKSTRYQLSRTEDFRGVKGLVSVYLDQASLETFGRYREGCSIDERIVAKVPLPNIFKNPDTGTLEVNGDERGADIFINGEKKGNIMQAFILSAGDHSWKAMKCPDEKIKVEPNRTLRRYCEKSGRIR